MKVRPMDNVRIHVVAPQDFAAIETGLAEIMVDGVNGGAAISFMQPYSVDDGRRFFFQPCFSVVWDTAIAAFALGEAIEPPHDALRRSADWLLTKEVRRKGDWSVKRPNTEPSGWAFEYSNEFYPDVDDTAMVMLALSTARARLAVGHAILRWRLGGFRRR